MKPFMSSSDRAPFIQDMKLHEFDRFEAPPTRSIC